MLDRQLSLVLLFSAAFLLLSSPAASVTLDWVVIGDEGNVCDPQNPGCYGAVAYEYRISKHETTNAQYAEFLNAVAETDSNDLYDVAMGSGFGGITQSGSPGSYTYGTIAGRQDMPVTFVTFWDAVRFANWMHNGQPTGAQSNATTEDGAYTLTPDGITNNTVLRNIGALFFVASNDEWFKAAYFDGTSYFDYPAGTDAETVCALPGVAPNTANCDSVVGDFADVGSYTGAASPYGTFDQGGNAGEWTDTIEPGGPTMRIMRGGRFSGTADAFVASTFTDNWPTVLHDWLGFRIAGVVPNQPPDCTAAMADPATIWPPNHKFEDVSVRGVPDPEGDPVTITITGIAQDEPLEGRGDGKTCPDASGIGTSVAEVRAERSGTRRTPGDGRVYHVSFTADDEQGGQCSSAVTVCVPHDQSLGHACVDQGPLFDSADCTK